MVQLRVDVEAANARREFDATSRTVDRLADELDDAEDEARRLRTAFNLAGTEADRLQRQVAATDRRLDELRSTAAAMGNMMPANLREELRRTERASRELHRELDQTENATRRLGQAANAADDNVARLADELDDAERQADQLRRALDRLDREAGTSLNSVRRGLMGFQQGLSETIRGGFKALPAEAKAAIVAAVGVAAVTLASVAGAAINGAILAAVGGGALAAGIALAMKNSNIAQAAFGGLGREIQQEVNGYAAMFEKPLVKAADIFGAAWDRVGPGVGRIFASLVDQVEPLALGLSRMAERAMPGIEKAAAAAGPVLEQLANDLPELGDAAADMFSAFADGEGAVKGVRAIVVALAAAMRLLGTTVNFLSDNWDRITESMSRFMHAASDIPGLGRLLEPFENLWSNLNNEMGGSVKAMDGATVAADGTTMAMARQAEATRQAAEQAQQLSNKLHGLITAQMSADQAAVAWEQAIDDVAESFRQNGVAIDIANQKGRDNVSIVQQAIMAAEAKRQAAIELAGGERASAAAVDAANAAYRTQIDQLRAVLRQAGLTEAQINQLLGAYQAMANAPDITKRINVYHTTYYREVGGPNYRRVPGGQVALASGTPSAPAGVALVGEEGPELVRFGGGERVYDAASTARMLSGNASSYVGGGRAPGAAPVVAAPTNANRGILRALEKAQRREVRSRARGSSQRYLGSPVIL